MISINGKLYPAPQYIRDKETGKVEKLDDNVDMCNFMTEYRELVDDQPKQDSWVDFYKDIH